MSGQTNGGVFNPKNLSLFTYTYNNPVNMIDPDGEAVKLFKAAFNILRNTYKHGDIKKASKDELMGIYDNVSELLDGDLTTDDFFAAVDLFTGFGDEAKVASDLAKIKPNTKEWTQAVDALKDTKKGSSKVNIRTETATEAKQLLEEAKGTLPRYKNYSKDKGVTYKKGYEVHNNQNKRELGVGNDLQHIKWKDNGTDGHIYYDKPN